MWLSRYENNIYIERGGASSVQYAIYPGGFQPVPVLAWYRTRPAYPKRREKEREERGRGRERERERDSR